MNERALQDLVVLCCKTMGLVVYHTHDSRRSVPGFPDLCIIGARGILWRELKSSRGRVSRDQQYFIDVLTAAGSDIAVWRPADWPHVVTKELEQLGRVRAQRPLPSQADVRRRLQIINARGH